MHEQKRHRLTGTLFLAALAIVFVPMVFDGDGLSDVDLDPISVTTPIPDVAHIDEVAPQTGFVERVRELRLQVDEEGFQTANGARFGDAVLTVPDASTRTWAIQVASFAEIENAVNFRNLLREDGFEAFATQYKQPDLKVVHRVAVGPYLKLDQAESARATLSDLYGQNARLMTFSN
jgi:DedD protein